MATDQPIPDRPTPSLATTAPTGRRLGLRRFWRRARLPLGVLLGVLIALLVAVPWHLRAVAQPYIYSDISRVPARPVAMVLGATVYKNGAMSETLRRRVLAGVALYKAHKVKTLLITGANYGPDYDEVDPMTAYSERLGVPASAIIVDGHSFRTYDSCDRARAVYHVRSAIIVTQDFHLPRALYLARHRGIDAVGYTASPSPRWTTQAVEEIRERFASVLAPLDIALR